MDFEMDNAMMIGLAMWVIVGGIMAKMMYTMMKWPKPMLITIIVLFLLFLLPICVFSAKKWSG